MKKDLEKIKTSKKSRKKWEEVANTSDKNRILAKDKLFSHHTADFQCSVDKHFPYQEPIP